MNGWISHVCSGLIVNAVNVTVLPPAISHLEIRGVRLLCAQFLFFSSIFFHSFILFKLERMPRRKTSKRSIQEHQLNGKCKWVCTMSNSTHLDWNESSCDVHVRNVIRFTICFSLKWQCLSIFLPFTNDRRRLQIEMTRSGGVEKPKKRTQRSLKNKSLLNVATTTTKEESPTPDSHWLNYTPKIHRKD